MLERFKRISRPVYIFNVKSGWEQAEPLEAVYIPTLCKHWYFFVLWATESISRHALFAELFGHYVSYDMRAFVS